ncbi:MAG: hypothetical protein E6700_10425, partial [Winkia neuii]|uniref:hypothetical protein n=1 Tax=Winkia neuii TaxID=33007 RepID=UPI0028FFB186
HKKLPTQKTQTYKTAGQTTDPKPTLTTPKTPQQTQNHKYTQKQPPIHQPLTQNSSCLSVAGRIYKS